MSLVEYRHFLDMVTQKFSASMLSTENVFSASFDHTSSTDRNYGTTTAEVPFRHEGSSVKALFNVADLGDARKWHVKFHQAIKNGFSLEKMPNTVHVKPSTLNYRGPLEISPDSLTDERLREAATNMGKYKMHFK